MTIQRLQDGPESMRDGAAEAPDGAATGERSTSEEPSLESTSSAPASSIAAGSEPAATIDTAVSSIDSGVVPRCEPLRIQLEFSGGEGDAVVESGPDDALTQLLQLDTEGVQVEGTPTPSPPVWPVAPEDEWDRSRTPAGACTLFIRGVFTADDDLACYDLSSMLLYSDKEPPSDVAMSFYGNAGWNTPHECTAVPGCAHSFPDYDNWFYLAQEGNDARLVLCGHECSGLRAVLHLYPSSSRTQCDP